MGHEKVAHLPFYTCPCDILSGIPILRRVFEQLVNSHAVTIPPSPSTADRPRSHVVDLDSSVDATDPGYFFVAQPVYLKNKTEIDGLDDIWK